jgi:hypothetical protein
VVTAKNMLKTGFATSLSFSFSIPFLGGKRKEKEYPGCGTFIAPKKSP